MAVLTLKRWNLSIGDGQPLVIIAGLNVLEDLDMTLAVGRELQATCAAVGLPFVFKASFDKANRSNVDGVRGPGLEAGLAALERVRAGIDSGRGQAELDGEFRNRDSFGIQQVRGDFHEDRLLTGCVLDGGEQRPGDALLRLVAGRDHRHVRLADVRQGA